MGIWSVRYTAMIPVVLATLVEDCCNFKKSPFSRIRLDSEAWGQGTSVTVTDSD